MRFFRTVKEKITGQDAERGVWRSLADSEIDLMPLDMQKEYAKWLNNRDRK